MGEGGRVFSLFPPLLLLHLSEWEGRAMRNSLMLCGVVRGGWGGLRGCVVGGWWVRLRGARWDGDA